MASVSKREKISDASLSTRKTSTLPTTNMNVLQQSNKETDAFHPDLVFTHKQTPNFNMSTTNLLSRKRKGFHKRHGSFTLPGKLDHYHQNNKYTTMCNCNAALDGKVRHVTLSAKEKSLRRIKVGLIIIIII